MHKSLPSWIVEVSHEPVQIQENVKAMTSFVCEGLSV